MLFYRQSVPGLRYGNCGGAGQLLLRHHADGGNYLHQQCGARPGAGGACGKFRGLLGAEQAVAVLCHDSGAAGDVPDPGAVQQQRMEALVSGGHRRLFLGRLTDGQPAKFFYLKTKKSVDKCRPICYHSSCVRQKQHKCGSVASLGINLGFVPKARKISN